ncbi:hypothetical protein [Epilithonimonas caeni]|uniref:hypothetical protein n=1 Tax=Epilithonimonas caeni TaxID=365343 RepID=UPI000483F390|nr:hypothetical protein [Epilithonimonas caeni]
MVNYLIYLKSHKKNVGKFPACYGSPTKGNNTKQKERPRIPQALQLFFPCHFEKFGRISATGSKAKRYILNDFISNYYINLSIAKITIYIMNQILLNISQKSGFKTFQNILIIY